MLKKIHIKGNCFVGCYAKRPRYSYSFMDSDEDVEPTYSSSYNYDRNGMVMAMIMKGAFTLPI